MRLLTRHLAIAILALPVALAACQQEEEDEPMSLFDDRWNADRGAELIRDFGCGACHIIPGIRPAEGLVGPPLDHMGRRVFIAGMLQNTPENMVTWLRNPQEIVPGNAMPDVGLSEEQARDITAYLYTLQ